MEIEINPEQAWFWTPEWREAEKKADEDIKSGNYESFDTMEDLLEDLFE